MKHLLLILALLLPAAAHARQDAGTRDVYIVVNNASRQRTSPAAAALDSLLRDTGRLGELADAWSAFARTLRWNEADAFDQLLGARVMLVLRALDRDGARHWAILSEITPEAEKRLTTSLRPAPRGLVGGHTVLAVEHGRYELAIGRGGWKPNLGNRPTVILLAPGGTPLFEELIPLLSGRFSIEGGDDADVFVLLRESLQPAFDGGPPRSLDFSVRATLDEDRKGWTARLSSNSSRPPGQITPWSTASFEGLQRDSLVAIMGVTGAPPLSSLGRWFGMPAIALPGSAGVGQRIALAVREVGDTPLGLARAQRHPARADTPEPRGVTVTLAVETPDLPRLVSTGDSVAVSMVPFLSGQAAALVPPPAPFDVGLREHQVRAVELQPLAGSLASAFGPDPVFTWAFGRSKPSFAQLTGSKVEPRAAPGWWVMSLAPQETVRAVSPTETIRDLFARELPDPLQIPRLSVGVVRPSALQALAGPLDPALTAALRPGRWVETIRWDSWLSAEGTVEGELRVRMEARP